MTLIANLHVSRGWSGTTAASRVAAAYARSAPEHPAKMRLLKAVSFEPNPTSFLRLLANIRANGRDNVTLVHAPLGRPENGLLPWRNSGATGGTTAWSHAAKHDEAPDYWLATTSFQDALRATGLSTPTLVKMDVEGAELSVLQGFDFEHVTPSYFLIEAQPHWPEKHAFLTARGYRASGENGAPLQGKDNDAFLEGNALFTKKSDGEHRD